MGLTIDRAGLRDAIQQKLLDVDELADNLQIEVFEGNAESDSGRQDWFKNFLAAQKGGIAVSYAGSQEVETPTGRGQQPVLVLLLYTRYEAAALGYLGAMEEALDGQKIVTGGKAYWAYWAADQMTGGEADYYEYEVRIRIQTE